MTQRMLAMMPATTPGYMAPAWASCLLWAVDDPKVVAMFRRDTGLNELTPDVGPKFVEWFNRHVWGEGEV